VNLLQTTLRTQLEAYAMTGHIGSGLQLLVNEKPVAVDPGRNITLLLPLNIGENTFTFRATDAAGNTATSVHILDRTEPPETPQGLFGLGEASYALLPAMLIIGVAATFALLRFGRPED